MIAPDYPGFGQSDAPDRTEFSYTFDHIAGIMEKFLNQIGVDRFYMYVFDYGAPIGFRIAAKHPERIMGIISQYVFGTEDGSVSPDGYSLDIYYSNMIPDYAEKQADYGTNC